MLFQIAQKREQFVVNLKKSAREDKFRKNRFPNKDSLPFSHYTQHCPQSYLDAYERADESEMHFQSNQMELDESMSSYIFKIKQLSNYLDEHDCNPEMDISYYVQIIFKIFNQGYPQIDKSCLHVLLTFSAENHQQSQPIQQHLETLTNYFITTPYTQLKIYVLDILGNFAVDCYICRDLVLLLQIPQKLWQEVQRCNQKSIYDDYYNLITNLDRIKPDLSKQKLIELHSILQELVFQFEDPKQQQWLLNLLNRIYSIDKSKISLDFLQYLLSIEIQTIELASEIFKYFHYVSLLDVETNSNYQISIIENMLQNMKKFYSQENIKAGSLIRLIKRIFTIINNFLLGDPQIIHQILQGELLYCIQHPQDMMLQEEYFSLVDSLIKFASISEVKLINEGNSLIKIVVQQLQEKDQSQELIHHLLKITLRLLYDNEQNKTIFYDEDGESTICKLQKQVNEENNEIIIRIFDFLDQ